MANRFLETNYYKSPFVRSLKGAIKGLYSFIICDCTQSGVWAKDMEAASMYIGFNVTDFDFIENFVDRGKAIDIGGNKFFFPDFIEHQYPKGLQENNPAHRNIIFELNKYDLLDEKNQVKVKKNRSPFKAPPKPLFSPIGNGNGNGEGYGNGKGQGNGVGSDEPDFIPTAIVPQMISLWYTQFPTASRDNQNDLPAMQRILAFILKQAKINSMDMNEHYLKILNTLQIIADDVEKTNFWVNKPLKSIANNIQEFYNNIKNPINAQKNGTHVNGKQQSSLRERVQAKVTERFNAGK